MFLRIPVLLPCSFLLNLTISTFLNFLTSLLPIPSLSLTSSLTLYRSLPCPLLLLCLHFSLSNSLSLSIYLTLSLSLSLPLSICLSLSLSSLSLGSVYWNWRWVTAVTDYLEELNITEPSESSRYDSWSARTPCHTVQYRLFPHTSFFTVIYYTTMGLIQANNHVSSPFFLLWIKYLNFTQYFTWNWYFSLTIFHLVDLIFLFLLRAFANHLIQLWITFSLVFFLKVAVRHMSSPPVTEDEIANAAG